MAAHSVACPVCDAPLSVSENTVLSELIVCSSCSVPLEVRCLEPVTLEEAPSEEEDWGQ